MTTKYYWHIHHDELCEPTENIQQRIDYINVMKPEDEREIRLRLMKPVKNQKAVRAIFNACDEAMAPARAKCDKALEALHRKECENCPWDGKTIFPERD
jgi:hypothetical protein